jgi:hypothetical protein
MAGGFPTAVMARDQDRRPALVAQFAQDFAAHHLDPAGLVQFCQMRPFTQHAAEIVPNPVHDAVVRVRCSFREDARQIVPRNAVGLHARADGAQQPTAQRRCAVERYRRQQPIQHPGAECLRRVGEPADQLALQRRAVSHRVRSPAISCRASPAPAT